jgi:TolA-binding protein
MMYNPNFGGMGWPMMSPWGFQPQMSPWGMMSPAMAGTAPQQQAPAVQNNQAGRLSQMQEQMGRLQGRYQDANADQQANLQNRMNRLQGRMDRRGGSGNSPSPTPGAQPDIAMQTGAQPEPAMLSGGMPWGGFIGMPMRRRGPMFGGGAYNPSATTGMQETMGSYNPMAAQPWGWGGWG